MAEAITKSTILNIPVRFMASAYALSFPLLNNQRQDMLELLVDVPLSAKAARAKHMYHAVLFSMALGPLGISFRH